MDLDEYRSIEASWSLWRRASVWLEDSAQYYYRSAGVAFAYGSRVEAIAYLAVAGLASPSFVGKRIWSQRYSRRARTALRAPTPDAAPPVAKRID